MTSALTISWCWEWPALPETSPAAAPEATPENKPEPAELPVPEQLVHLLFDRLRDFPEAYRAMQETVRQWRHRRRQPGGPADRR